MENSEYNQIIQDNKGLVYHWAKYFRRPGITQDELVAVGMEGLWKAAQKYDVTKGASFGNYASLWIKHYMRRYVKKQSIIATPFAKPTNYYFEQLDESMEDTSDPLQAAIAGQDSFMVRVALSKLSTKERQVLAWRYERDMTFVEIAQELGCARESARMLHNSAIESIRQILSQEEE